MSMGFRARAFTFKRARKLRVVYGLQKYRSQNLVRVANGLLVAHNRKNPDITQNIGFDILDQFRLSHGLMIILRPDV